MITGQLDNAVFCRSSLENVMHSASTNGRFSLRSSPQELKIPLYEEYNEGYELTFNLCGGQNRFFFFKSLLLKHSNYKFCCLQIIQEVITGTIKGSVTLPLSSILSLKLFSEKTRQACYSSFVLEEFAIQPSCLLTLSLTLYSQATTTRLAPF